MLRKSTQSGKVCSWGRWWIYFWKLISKWPISNLINGWFKKTNPSNFQNSSHLAGGGRKTKQMETHLNQPTPPVVFRCFLLLKPFLREDPYKWSQKKKYTAATPKVLAVQHDSMTWFVVHGASVYHHIAYIARENIWMFLKMVVPQNGWFIMENPMKNRWFRWWFGETIIFGNTHILPGWIYTSKSCQPIHALQNGYDKKTIQCVFCWWKVLENPTKIYMI